MSRSRRSAAVGAGWRTLLCAIVAVGSVLSPWESGLLPEPLQHLLGADEAQAQTPPPPTVVPGMPEACPTAPADWSPQPGDADYGTQSECVLELPACPESYLYASGFMRLSVPPTDFAVQFPDLDPGDLLYTDIGLERYQHFCEERVLDTEAEYSVCQNATGVAVKSYIDGGVDGCRILTPIRCPAGLQQVTATTCRGVQRRMWTCAMAGDIPRNEFNSCYRDAGGSALNHPVCGTGAPVFAVGTCEEYVGADFVDSPADDCLGAYSTDTPVINSAGDLVIAGAAQITLANTANPHWCQHDAQLLRSVCHRTDSRRLADCDPPVSALCLRRASQTGGCDAVAQVIRCRAYEVAWRQEPDTMTLAEVRINGCSPCHVNPFQRMRKDGRQDPLRVTGLRTCPTDMYASPRQGFSKGVRIDGIEQYDESTQHKELHRLKDDNGECADPPAGRLTSSPTHHSGLAVVNSAVLVHVSDIRYRWEARPPRHFLVSTDPPLAGPDSYNARWRVRYHDGDEADVAVRTWNTANDSTPFATVSELADKSECVPQHAPTFRLVVRELWPDDGPTYDEGNADCVYSGTVPVPDGNDAEMMLALFGSDALRWWCALSQDQRKSRTAAHGLTWLDDPLDDVIRDARRTALTTELPCDHDLSEESHYLWCRWQPSRPGFYVVHVGGAWRMHQYERRRNDTSGLLTYLNDTADGQMRRQKLLDDLADINSRYPTLNRTVEDLGLRFADATQEAVVIPVSATDLDWMYDASIASTAACPPVDLRFWCVTSEAGNYTETEPIGIMVHEARVVSRPPSGP
ncbi:hypothetical protein [Candidatus Poriferisodalis sp.]|uniref:hypothetical protein n=1 Tax=Candidatus Poriferisodalis sp. TaxID=3101277 RepID=UPI003AF4AAC8